MDEVLGKLKQPTQKVVEYLDGVTVDGKNIEFVSDVQAKPVSENLVEVTIKFFAKDYKLMTGYLKHENKYDFTGIDEKEEEIIMDDKRKERILEKFSKDGLINLDYLTNSFYAKLVGEEMVKDKKSPGMVVAIAELYKVIKNQGG